MRVLCNIFTVHSLSLMFNKWRETHLTFPIDIEAKRMSTRWLPGHIFSAFSLTAPTRDNSLIPTLKYFLTRFKWDAGTLYHLFGLLLFFDVQQSKQNALNLSFPSGLKANGMSARWLPRHIFSAFSLTAPTRDNSFITTLKHFLTRFEWDVDTLLRILDNFMS